MHFIVDFIKHALETWGYWAVLLALLGENAGIPLPGETILLFASFLAYKGEHLKIHWIILVGVCACTIGDNIGFAIGHYGGRPLLHRWKRFFHIDDTDIADAERLLQRRGWFTIFIARFIAGLRIVAGPLAGVLGMPWRKFITANACGAVVWVSTIAGVGYAFGSKSDELIAFLDRLNIFVFVAVVIGVWLLLRRHKKKRRERREKERRESSTIQ